MMRSDRQARTLGWALALAGLEGVLVVTWLLLLPGSRLSLSRFVVIAPGLLLALACGTAGWRAWRQPEWGLRVAGRLEKLASRDGLYRAALVFCVLTAFLCSNLLALYWVNTDQYVQAYLQRMAPYSLWALLVSLKIAMVFRLLRFGTHPTTVRGHIKTLAAAAIALAVFLLVGAFMGVTRLGLEPDQVAWGDPGVPLLGWQILLALAITLVGLLVVRALWPLWKRVLGTSNRRLDFIIFLILWVAAVWRWGVEPLRPSYFSPVPQPPTYEFFPYSDAANYDYAAHSLLAGYGMGGDVVRPFYSFFLAVAHAASGLGYDGALIWQIPLLALLPSLLFVIARVLHNRISGFFVGLLAILHNSNAIALAGVTNVSHAKMLMSDVPTALGIAAVTAIILLWLENPESRRAHPLVAGGILAIVMLVRVQILALLPVALLAIWIGSYRSRRIWSNTALLLAGFGCVLVPWLWRNWQLAGELVLSEASQASQIGLIGQRYSLTVEKEKGKRMPGESDDDYSARMVQSATGFVRQYPGETARFITAHFLHNQVATLLVLPSSFPTVEYLNGMLSGTLLGKPPKLTTMWERCCALRSYAKSSTYWNAWDGQILSESILPILFSLLAIGVGIGTGWHKGWLAAALPLAMNLSYSLSNALVRNSGWRFNQPVDWTGYLFYGIGFIQLGQWGLAYFFPRAADPDSSWVPSKSTREARVGGVWGKAFLAGLVFLLLSSALPISEKLIPERYGSLNIEEVLSGMEAKGLLAANGIDYQDIADFLSQPRAQALIGQALYPRFYLSGEGEPGSGWPSFMPRPYERLGFYMVGPQRRHVVLRIPSTPASFPHASDVLVVGCSADDYLDAFLVADLSSQETVLLRSPLDSWTCSGG